jgi:hypothetical protein
MCKEWAYPCPISTGTGLTTPHTRQDWAHPADAGKCEAVIELLKASDLQLPGDVHQCHPYATIRCEPTTGRRMSVCARACVGLYVCAFIN